jgi:hypothetical protein
MLTKELLAKAVINNTFNISRIKLDFILSLQDIKMISAFLSERELTEIDLSLYISEENSMALTDLAQALKSNAGLQKLSFKVEGIILGENQWSADFDALPQIDRTLSAIPIFLENKPHLTHVVIDAEQLVLNLFHSENVGQALRSCSGITNLLLNFKLAQNVSFHFCNPSKTALKELSLGNIDDKAVASDLQNIVTLSTLKFSRLNLSPEGFNVAANLIRNNAPSLTHLAFNGIKFSADSMGPIQAAIQCCPLLKSLSLCNISGDTNLSLTPLLNALPQLEALMLLDIQGNTNWPDLIPALALHSSLRKLVLELDSLDLRMIESLCALIKTKQNIVSLSLKPSFETSNLKEIIEAISALIKDPACPLKELSLDYYSRLSFLQLLVSAVESNTKLEKFFLFDAGKSLTVDEKTYQQRIDMALQRNQGTSTVTTEPAPISLASLSIFSSSHGRINTKDMNWTLDGQLDKSGAKVIFTSTLNDSSVSRLEFSQKKSSIFKDQSEFTLRVFFNSHFNVNQTRSRLPNNPLLKFTEANEHATAQCELSFHVSQSLQLEELLSFLQRQDPTLESIFINFRRQIYRYVIKEDYQHGGLVRPRLLNALQFIPVIRSDEKDTTLPPPKWDNRVALKEMNYRGEIPSEFCCSIEAYNPYMPFTPPVVRRTIMTNPVYDPRSPEHKFEKKTIRGYLRHTRFHPYTKMPLTMEDLQLDQPLQSKIKRFVEAKREEYDAQNGISVRCEQ